MHQRSYAIGLCLIVHSFLDKFIMKGAGNNCGSYIYVNVKTMDRMTFDNHVDKNVVELWVVLRCVHLD